MREFVFGDIHGGYKALQALINTIAPTPKDQLIFLGDYVDGWSQAVETIDYLMELEALYNCVYIKGNPFLIRKTGMNKKSVLIV